MKPGYTYRAQIVSVYDGDTVRADIDLGMKTWIRNEPLRLARIDAPELRGEEREAGLDSRDYLEAAIGGREVIIVTDKDKAGKYGRYIAEIWTIDNSSNEWINVNDRLVAAGHAHYRTY